MIRKIHVCLHDNHLLSVIFTTDKVVTRCLLYYIIKVDMNAERKKTNDNNVTIKGILLEVER